jgi:adenosylcobinamide kinase/adenosylcobinamide-phosphate guanylyltransferase
VLGGARSGKSAHAEGLVPADSPVRYLATGRSTSDADPGAEPDTDWLARIAEHRARRPASWVTIEAGDPVAVISGACADDPPLLLDDVATWLTGVLDDHGAWDGGPAELAAARRQVRALVNAVARCPARLVLVSSEVGLGVVPATRSGRLFRDELGRCNALLADACHEVLLLVAGIPLRLR